MNSKRISVGEPQLIGNELAYVTQCVRENALTHGRFVTQFETQFAEYVGVRHAIACMNGTVALHLALLALGVKPGDEVLIPTLTYVATANAVRYCGATPVLCDVEPGTWTIALDEIDRKRSKRTVGVLPVHLYGTPAEMNEINALAAHYGWWVLEDAAEAHGAQYRGRPAGALATAATFSFYGNKILTCGEGGMVTTNDQRIEERARLLRGQGMSPVRRYYHPVLGYNYRMTNLQAALGCAQLERATWHVEQRASIAEDYRRKLAACTVLDWQVTRQYAQSSHWMVTVLLPAHVSRDEAITLLDSIGIETRPAFIGMHQLPMYASSDAYPVADDVTARGINLPTHAGLTPPDVARVCDAIATVVTM